MRRSINTGIKRWLYVIHAFYLMWLATPAIAQTDIPIGSWRLHLSYNNIKHLQLTPEKVFAASESGILVFNRDEKTLGSYNKLNGLSNTAITSLGYDHGNNKLLIGYSDGDLDIISASTVTNFSRLKDAEVTTSKTINHISVRGNLAYLSTAYGVVVFDIHQGEIKETWRDLGASGQGLRVNQSTFLNDSIFIATANGVLAGNLADNLLDFNNWMRFSSGDFSGPIPSIVTFNNKVYVAGPTGVYRFGNSNWQKEIFLDTAVIGSLTSSGQNLFMIADSTIWSMNSSGQLTQITDDLIQVPAVVRQDDDSKLWVGDQLAGLVSNTGGNFSSYLPDGPGLAETFRMIYDNGKLFALPGGFNASGQPLKNPGLLSVFENGNWTTSGYSPADLTDIAFHDSKTFVSSFGSGVSVTDASGNVTVLNATNSPLASTDPGKSNITALAPSADGLWVANYGGNEPLHLLKSDGTWESLSIIFPNSQNPVDMALDRNGDVWMILNPASGGGLVAFEREDNQAHYKTNVVENGGLPDKNVLSITADLDGYIWVGTDAGVAYFFSVGEDAVKPIYESRFLLRDEKITAIAVDAGNRKWIGTERGVWLFNATGESLVHHFTSENSPLLSNVIQDIEINSKTGEVFFATDQGIISYRSDAVSAGPEFEKIKIFPNPVSPGYHGTVGISGLASDAYVRITDISGKLIWQTQANGGMATWNVRDQEGRRAATGVYLVFAASQNGRESIVGKVAVIE
ncbi:MAG: hypothetical protein WD824_01195 [Cyclobacteriaceae bacterium]